MQAEWRNAARTILALTDVTGHVVIVEPGHALWPKASKRPDITPFAPDPIPEPEPEDLQAAIPPLTRRQVFIALRQPASFLQPLSPHSPPCRNPTRPMPASPLPPSRWPTGSTR